MGRRLRQEEMLAFLGETIRAGELGAICLAPFLFEGRVGSAPDRGAGR